MSQMNPHSQQTHGMDFLAQDQTSKIIKKITRKKPEQWHNN